MKGIKKKWTGRSWRGMAVVECNLKSFLVKLRKTRAVRGHGTPSVRKQRQSGRPASRTMTGGPTDFNYGIRAGKTPNFPISTLPLALFFGSTWPCNFNRTRSHPDPLPLPLFSPLYPSYHHRSISTRLQENIDECRITIRSCSIE